MVQEQALCSILKDSKIVLEYWIIRLQQNIYINNNARNGF